MTRSRGLLAMVVSLFLAACGGTTAQERAICQQDLAAVRSENARLREQLASAAAPARVTLNNPDIVELATGPATKQADQGPPTLDPRDASRIVMAGAPALQRCYEEALRTNVALGDQKGLRVLLQITVAPTGMITKVDINPPVDQKLVDCFRGEIRGWIFPKFEGSSVVLEQKLLLTPVTSPSP